MDNLLNKKAIYPVFLPLMAVIFIGYTDPQSGRLKDALARNKAFRAATLQEAVNHSDPVFQSIPFQANEPVQNGLSFHSKTLVDCTNPIGPGITHGLKCE